MIRVMVQGLTIDQASNSPILILKEAEGERNLPIWIGLLEATAIASELEKVDFSRPMTHDLMKNILGTLDFSLSKVEVTELKDNTFYALLHLLGPKGSVTVDSRPSDAIALALRCEAPIFVSESVLEQSALSPEAGPRDSQTDDKWKEILENMDPEDFGKYKM